MIDREIGRLIDREAYRDRGGQTDMYTRYRDRQKDMQGETEAL